MAKLKINFTKMAESFERTAKEKGMFVGWWIPLKTRPMTEEEKACHREWAEYGMEMFDCPLPDDGQEVLISYHGDVCVDTFVKDDGCYFEGVDIDEVEAWMPKPEPYRSEKGGEE